MLVSFYLNDRHGGWCWLPHTRARTL